MNRPNPMILIVPGAGHDASFWNAVKQHFEKMSYAVICESLPSLQDATKSWHDDRDFLLGLIEPHMDKVRAPLGVNLLKLIV